MALNSSTLTSIMISQCAANGLHGQYIPPLCSAFSQGIVTSFLSMNIVNTADVGFIVTGAGIGKMSGLSVGVLFPLMSAQLASRGINGLFMPPLARAISTAVVTHFLAANIVNTVSKGIAIGTGVGKVSGLIPSTMFGTTMGFMASHGLTGIMLPQLVSGVSTAVCLHINADSIVNVKISGNPVLRKGAMIPGVGVGVGKVS